MKNRSRPHRSGDPVEGAIVEPSDPDADGELRGITDRPAIPEICRGAGLCRDAEGKIEWRIQPECSGPGLSVAENVRDDPGAVGIENTGSLVGR